MGESYVIVGDGIAGSSAAETLRERSETADITVITDEKEALYNRILIKEHAKGNLPETPIRIHDEEWYAERDIDIRLGTAVVTVDSEANEIVTHEGDVLQFDKLLVATGGTPRHLPVKNADADGIHRFWTFEDARRIREHADSAERGVVIGAGLLGIDLAAVCGAQDVKADYLMRGRRWWRYALSDEGAEIIHDELRKKGVTPRFESGVDRFETDESGHVSHVVDPSGERYAADFVGVAIGLDYNTEFIQETDVETDGGIIVDEQMQTTHEDVYAAGDIARFYDPVLGERNQNGSWDSAQVQGKVAAANMVGDDEAFAHVPSYSITHFDVPFLSFGHPTRGDRYCERRYSDTEWRRLAIGEDGQLVGGVLIGDLAPQRVFKSLIETEAVVSNREEALLEKRVDSDAFED